jgi:glycosyltransferase involved in cell wall biosynthesis
MEEREELMKSVKVAVVIPAYNESAAIQQVVHNIHRALRDAKYTHEVIVVDDGSNDNTAELAGQAGAKVIRHILNTGAGGATATGLSYAYQSGATIAATMDADGQHDSADVVRGIEKIQHSDYDLLIGSRLINSEGMSPVKIVGNRGLSFVTIVLFGINTTDSQSGLRIFSRRSLASLRWTTSGYEFCSEMLWRAKQIGLRIGEFPIEAIYTEYSTSKGQNNWNGVNIVAALIRRRLTELFR